MGEDANTRRASRGFPCGMYANFDWRAGDDMWLKHEKRVRLVPEDAPIRSFRGWQFHCDGCWHGRKHKEHDPLLLSVYAGVSWPPGDQEARMIGTVTWNITWNADGSTDSYANASQFTPTCVVASGGQAGIYGMKQLGRLVERIDDHSRTGVLSRHLIYGSIFQWGIVVEHEDGYRSQFARIERIYVPRAWEDEQVAKLAARYATRVSRRKVAA